MTALDVQMFLNESDHKAVSSSFSLIFGTTDFRVDSCRGSGCIIPNLLSPDQWNILTNIFH